MSFTIGSLFDGSGGFPLAAFLCGGTPKWASEVEPYPIAVTKTRFPYMKHLGSVTDIKGNEVEPVDVITFGSPCQDLSVAGKRAGLKHTDNGDEETTRSGLFMEAVRIIKEMREATNGKYPRFALWENVPGAFSSNKGEDFRIVLEELIKIVEPTAVMPAVPKNGWNYADYYCGDGWSLAYRVFDAQYWGVPQRRRRIYLVLDLRGQCAREVSFEREGLRGYFTEGRTPWQGIAGDVADCSGTADCERASGVTAYGISPYHSNCMKSDNPHSGIYVADTARTLDAMNCGYPACNQGGIAVVEPITLEPGIAAREGGHVYEKATHYKCAPVVCYSGGFCPETGGNDPSRSVAFQEELSPTLRAGATPAVVGVYKADDGSTGNACPTLVGDHNNRVTDHSALVLCCKPVVYNGENITHPLNKTNPQPGDPCHTLGTDSRNYVVLPDVSRASGKEVTGCLMASGYEKLGAQEMFSGDYTVVEKRPTVCLEGNGSRPSHRGDGYSESDTMYTLNATEHHGVAYSLETFHCEAEEEKTAPLKARDYKDPLCDAIDRAYFNQGQNAQYTPQTYEDGTTPTLVAKGPSAVAYGVDCRNATETAESNGALQAACCHNHNSNNVVRVQYIVRRLTPTECARLQGFADRWATPDTKTEFSDEEYKFWLNVRNTHAEINGKTTKAYTKEQMLTWYNKLHTDSAAYKLWGNGIALPTALYLMEGIAEVFANE